MKYMVYVFALASCIGCQPNFKLFALNIGKAHATTDEELVEYLKIPPSKSRPYKNRSIFLDFSSVTDAGLKPLANVPNLEHLDLRYSDIKGPGLAHIANLKNLKELDLEHTLVRDKHLIHVGKISSLEQLDLCNDQKGHLR